MDIVVGLLYGVITSIETLYVKVTDTPKVGGPFILKNVKIIYIE